MEVERVVSLSEAVIDKVPSCSSIRKQSRIGREFLELMTRLIACKWLNKAVLETINFMFLFVLNFYVLFVHRLLFKGF